MNINEVLLMILGIFLGYCTYNLISKDVLVVETMCTKHKCCSYGCENI